MEKQNETVSRPGRQTCKKVYIYITAQNIRPSIKKKKY